MDVAKAFIQANKDLLPVILKIKDDQWNLPAPPKTSWKPNQTLRNLVNYHAYDDAWVPDVLAGKTAAEVGDQFESLLDATDTLARRRSLGSISAHNSASVPSMPRFGSTSKIRAARRSMTGALGSVLRPRRAGSSPRSLTLDAELAASWPF